MNKQISIIIAGGGTGGHLYPAIAIGEALLTEAPNINLHFMGSRFGIESQVLPVKGLPHTLLPIRGLQRDLNAKSIGKNILLPGRLLKSIVIGKRIFKQYNPKLVIGTGGYASAIPLKIALRQNIPIILQEQNSFPGITTKYFAADAEKICVAFKDAKDELGPNAVLTGNPIRSNIMSGDKIKGGLLFDIDPNKKTIFLFGGSQGSIYLNEIMKNCIKMIELEKLQVIWQTGEIHYENFQKYESPLIKVRPYINRMSEAYAISDLIISRAGALTVAEITACGKPSILIPFPQSAADHQKQNALSLQSSNAALVLEENKLSSRILFRSITEILYNDNKLKEMSKNAKNIGITNATERIIKLIFEVIGN
jgi:UDP-N-acetylglucosamine--N-acetylmuramyl-(pentapeptide) pyrophosphoryl-undecaprenol N-acetylglucosamine transferase